MLFLEKGFLYLHSTLRHPVITSRLKFCLWINKSWVLIFLLEIIFFFSLSYAKNHFVKDGNVFFAFNIYNTNCCRKWMNYASCKMTFVVFVANIFLINWTMSVYEEDCLEMHSMDNKRLLFPKNLLLFRLFEILISTPEKDCQFIFLLCFSLFLVHILK